MTPRNDERVAAVHWPDIEEGNHKVALCNYDRMLLARNDLAEDAVMRLAHGKCRIELGETIYIGLAIGCVS